MIGAQLDVLDQDIYFIRPDVLQQLLPSLNQYFRYAELLVNGQQPRTVQAPGAVRPQINAGQAGMPLMNASPMMQNGMMVAQQPGNGVAGSPHLTPNMMGSPNMRPGMMMQGRPAMVGGARPMGMNQSMQTLQANQQIQLIQSRLLPIQQQLQQIQQMMSQGVAPEQMQVLQHRQQELLRNQEVLQQQYISLQQYGGSARQNVIRPVRPTGMADNQMAQQFSQMQGNAAAIANQRALQQQMIAQQMARGGQPMQARPGMNMLQQQQMLQQLQQQQLQQQQLNQQHQNALQDVLGGEANNSFLTQSDSFQGSPQLGTQKGSPGNTANAKPASAPSNQKKEAGTPQLSANVPQSNPAANANSMLPQTVNGQQVVNQLQGMQNTMMSPNMASMSMGMGMGVRPGVIPTNMTMMNQMGRPAQFMGQQGMGQQGMGQAGMQQMNSAGPMSPQMFVQQQMMNPFPDNGNFEQPIPRPGSAAGKKPQTMQPATTPTVPQGIPQGMQQGMQPGLNSGLSSMPAMTANAQFMTGSQPSKAPGIAPSPFAQQPPAPSPTTSQGPKSAGENWVDDFNFGADPTPTSAPTVETKEEGIMISLESNLEDYFNLDYEPPEFDTLQEPNLGEADFNFDISPPPKKAAKRSRDDEDDADIDKKVKTENVLEKELNKLTNDYPVTYTIKNTPAQSSTSSLMICFTHKSVSFSISVQNRGLYESGLSKGLLSFSTTQVPDTLTCLITDHVSPTSTSRVTDIVKIIVAAIKE
jgi:hypothetical protein